MRSDNGEIRSGNETPKIITKKHERLCNNHDSCHIEMPTRDNNTLKYSH